MEVKKKIPTFALPTERKGKKAEAADVAEGQQKRLKRTKTEGWTRKTGWNQNPKIYKKATVRLEPNKFLKEMSM